MKDEDIFAFRPAPGAAPPGPVAARPRRRVWPWVLGAFLLLALLALAGAVAALMTLAEAAREGVHVVVDNADWEPPALGVFGATLALLGVGAGLLVAGLVVATVVPLALLLALGCVVLAVGGALLPVLGLLALLLSPLWLALALLWWLLRRKPAPAATMPA